MKSLERIIHKLGLEEIQAKLYTEIYFQGETTVLELSRITGIKRPTVHFNVEQLIAKKFIQEDVRAGRRVVVARNPSEFVSLVEIKKREIEDTENQLKRVLEDVAIFDTEGINKGISVILDSGNDALERVYKEAFGYGEVYSYFNYLKGGDLTSIRQKLFNDVSLRRLLSSFSELYYSKDVEVPDFVKKCKGYEQFRFTKTIMKMYGNSVNILVYGKEIVIITKEETWVVMKLTQPILSMFIKEMIEAQISK